MFSTIIISLFSYLWSVNSHLTGDNMLATLILDNYGWQQMIERQVAGAAKEASRNLLPLEVSAYREEATLPYDAHLPAARSKLSLAPFKATTTEFTLAADSGIVLDPVSGSLLYEKNSDRVQPIASISKLMTALVFLDHNPGWERVYQLQPADRREGSIPYLGVGEKVKIKDLFYLSLVASANTETIALVNSTGLGVPRFVELMNAKARELGLKNTAFKDPVGLDIANISNALEVAKLTQAALAVGDIRQATLTKKHEFTTMLGNKITVENTDKLLEAFPPSGEKGIKIAGGKTGFTDEAGGCFASIFADGLGHETVSVVLGGAGRDARFSETKKLVEWVFSAYRWPE